MYFDLVFDYTQGTRALLMVVAKDHEHLMLYFLMTVTLFAISKAERVCLLLYSAERFAPVPSDKSN